MAFVADLTVLIVAPIGRDARLIQEALETAGVTSRILETVDAANQLVTEQSAGALLITEEVMTAGNISALAVTLSQHPAWSDLPILILTIGGRATPLSRQREKDRLPLGNVTLLERPIRMATLTSTVRSALRSRSRQYEVRDTLLQRDTAEASLRESESRLRLAVETANLGAWELDLQTGSLEVSPTGRKIFDWIPHESLTTSAFIERVHPEDRRDVEEKLNTAIGGSGEYAAEYRVVWRDGSTRWISASGRILMPSKIRSVDDGSAPQTPGGRRMVGVAMDITERVLSEAALRKADKLALVGRLTSSIAHEINNPLEAVTNLLYLLGLAALPQQEQEYVVMAQQELARVSEITAQTLTFNRQQNSFEEASLVRIIDSVLALYQGRLTTANIRVQRDYRFQGTISCYPGELRQVFTNLIGNAFDATRQGGRIRIRERIATHPKSGEKGVRIVIADTGTGMSPAVQSRLFEAFHSTKGNNGTGLGLWISKGIVQKHGGSLRFSSSQRPAHAGTAFSVFLPIKD